MRRIILVLVALSTFGCAEGDIASTQNGDTDIRPEADAGPNNGSDASGQCQPTTEICDGIDNDCDNAIDEDLGENTCGIGVCAAFGPACENGNAGVCVPGTPAATEACNGLDDDCDGETDEGCNCTPGDMQACYSGAAGTSGVGLCADGVQTCDAGQWSSCTGDITPTAEVCDDLDNDCDGEADNGNPGGGGTCSTGMPGVCGTGELACVNGDVECAQTVMPSAEICDGLDNDCNTATADGSADPLAGVACDGPDADACLEGVQACTAGAIKCSDNTGNSVELCDGLDNNCDGSIDEGLIRDTNPVCASTYTNLGIIDGDNGNDIVTDTGYSEEWFRVLIWEGSTASTYLSATVTLTSGAGTDFDLLVYCESCGGTLAGSSLSTGSVDTVKVRRNDTFGIDDDFYIYMQVRHASSSVCANWTLRVSGNTVATTETCP